jgi:cyanate permease
VTVASTGIGTVAVLAHQGGWDEILMVLTPIALFAALLWLANSRATRLQRQRATSPTDSTSTDEAASDGATSDQGPTDRTDPPAADQP